MSRVKSNEQNEKAFKESLERAIKKLEAFREWRTPNSQGSEIKLSSDELLAILEALQRASTG